MSRSLMLAFGFGVAMATPAKAQWLTHTLVANPPPNTQQTTAFFAGGVGAYAGPVTTIASNFVSGSTSGVPGISPNPFTNVTTGPGGFSNYYPLNPGSTFDFLNVGYNDVADTFTVTIDFSSLNSAGVLPPGAVIAFLDVDNSENVHSLSALNSLGNPIASTWLLQLPAATNLFDYDAAGGGLTAGQEAGFSQPSAGVFDLTGKRANQDSAFQGFRTNQAVKSLTFTFTNSLPPTIFGAGSYGIAIYDPQFVVPEPSSTALILAGGMAGLILYLRRLRQGAKAQKLRLRARMLGRRRSHGVGTTLGGSIFVSSHGQPAFRRVTRKTSAVPSRRSFASKRPQIHLKHLA